MDNEPESFNISTGHIPALRPPIFAARWNNLRSPAQAMLDKNDADCAAVRAGARPPCHPLQGLVRYAKGGRPFNTNGAKQQYLTCAGYLDGSCTCKTRLPRKLAERLISKAISDRIFQSNVWLLSTLDQALSFWGKRQRDNPAVELAEPQKAAMPRFRDSLA